MGTTEKIIKGIQEGLDISVSGAIHQGIGQPIKELKDIADNSFKKTEELTKRLIRWTKIMAFAIIVQALAIIVQIGVIIWTNLN